MAALDLAVRVNLIVLKSWSLPLHAAAREGDEDAIKQMCADTKYSVDERDTTNPGEYTPLHYAAVQGHPSSVTALLQAGADVDAVDSYGNTALLLAAAANNIDVARCLLRFKADPTLVNADRWTALHYAAYTRSRLVFSLLQDENVDVNALNDGNSTPLDLLVLHGSKAEIEVELIKHGAVASHPVAQARLLRSNSIAGSSSV